MSESDHIKEQLVNNIREWLKLDNELAQLKVETKEKTTRKKALTDELTVIMKSTGLDQLDINGGSLVYKQNKVRKPLNKKTMLEALKSYNTHDPLVAEELAKHLMDSRVVEVKEKIERKVAKLAS
jgi:hypothetical protein